MPTNAVVLTIYYTSHFQRSVKKYHSRRNKIVKKIKLFQENPFASSLKTHKLTGKLKDYWSFSIEKDLRIMFKFETKQKVTFIDIGPHSIYK